MGDVDREEEHTMDETKTLAGKCMQIELKTLPESTVDRAKYFLLDYIGVAARGALSDSSKPVHTLVTDLNATGKGAVIIGTPLRATPTYAAIANGAAAHSLEMDDVTNEASLHPGVAIMSAAFDAGYLGNASGGQFIEAVVAGYEVMIRLGICLNPSAHYKQGFHPTATCGTFGSAIAAGKLLGLNRAEMVNALGIAGSQTAGSMEFLTGGAYTKRLHPGWAAHAGIIAALLAKQGFTGPDTIIEGQSGFLKAYSPQSDLSKLFNDWGRPYKIEQTSIKPHSCCRYKQGPLDCILEIMRRQSLKPKDIETVTIAVLKTGVPIVAEPKEVKYNPKSVVDAQFSMPFGAAVAILNGKATLNEYVEKNLKDPAVREMMARVVCVQDDEIEREFPKKWPARVSIKTKNGKEYSTRIDAPKGDPENPLTWDELIEKFNTLSSPVFTEGRIKEIVTRVRHLETEKNMTSFSEVLAVAR
jgi:2-methylcitrate dehydratase PrpD